MENKPKIYKSTNNPNINNTQKDLTKQKLLKKDVKIVKGNKRPSTTTTTKSVNINNQNNHINNHPSSAKKLHNEKNNNTIKKTSKVIVNNKNSHLNKNLIKYNNLEEAVLILQKEVRKFLDKKKNDPKTKMIEKLKQRKIDILHNYRIIDNKKSDLDSNEKDTISSLDLNYNDILKNIKSGKKNNNNIDSTNIKLNIKEEKNDNDKIEDSNNLINKNSNENENNNNINNNNHNFNNIIFSNNNNTNNINNDNINLEKQKQKIEIEKEDIDDIEEDIPNSDLIGLDDKYNIDDIDEEIIKNYKVEPKEIKLQEKKPTSGRKKQELNVIVVSKKDDKEKFKPIIHENKKEEKNIKPNNQENIFEKIVKGMQKDKNEKKEDKKKKEINNISNQNQLPIKELPIENNTTDLKKSTNFENEQLNKIDNKDNNENIIETKNDLKNIENDLIESTKKDKIEEKEEIKPTDAFQRLYNFLDSSSLEQPSPLINKITEQNISLNNNNINNSNIINNDINSNINNINNNNNNSYNNEILIQQQNLSNFTEQADLISLKLELSESKKTIEIMTKAISELKKQLRDKDDYLNRTLLNKKNEFDSLINKQNIIMETIISEKNRLENQVNELQDRLNQNERNSFKKIQNIKDNYELETKKNKDAWFQAEKIRRKKWEEQKIKEIKELTAKGLEPELEKIITTYKNKISNLEEEHNKQLKLQKEKIIEEYELKYDELKKRYIKEKDEAIESEKEITIQRLRNQSERLEDEIVEERRRLNAKLQSEINRLESLREKDKNYYEEQIGKLEERNNNNMFNNENAFQKKIDDLRKEYDDKLNFEIENIKNNLIKENEEILKKKENDLEKKYKEMKLDLIKDRDKQINIVIEKLGEEALQDRKKNLNEAQKKANEKNLVLIEENNIIKKQLNEITEKLNKEIKNRTFIEEQLDLTTKKLELKNNDYSTKEKQYSELQEMYKNLSDKLSNLTREFNKEKMNMEIEMKSNLQKGDAEVALLNNKLQTAQKIFEKQKDDIEKTHQNEILEIQDKIKKTLKIKEEIIQNLQNELEKEKITNKKYEELLNQQRKEFFGN